MDNLILNLHIRRLYSSILLYSRMPYWNVNIKFNCQYIIRIVVAPYWILSFK